MIHLFHHTNQPDWGNVPTWGGAIVTTFALLVALYQTFRLRRQDRTDRQQARNDRLRAQAELIATWDLGSVQNPTQERIAILNASSQPIYDVITTIVFVQGAGPHFGEEWANVEDRSGVWNIHAAVPPGSWTTKHDWKPYNYPMQGVIGVEIAFTDLHGSHWIRRADGQLEKLGQHQAVQYGHQTPFGYLQADPNC